MSGRCYIKTVGCQMNEYDSARMADVLRVGAALTPTDDPARADVLLMNTCSVREKAQDKVYSLLGEWRAHKQQRPHVIIGVGGCVASQEGDAITARAPFVDLVFGPQTIHRLPAMLGELRRHGRAVIDVSFPEIEKFDRLPEVRALAEQGVAEVTLLGQNVNAYAGVLEGGARADLAVLIHHVARIPGIERIRFTTSHPLEFNDSLIEAYATVPQLAHHLHLPVQSGSDRILALMKRGYTALEYKDKLRRLRAVRPGIAVSSDFIVGFPGETERDFEATLRLVAEAELDQSFC